MRQMNKINACFESVGAALAWYSAALAVQEAPRGVSWLMVAFSALWAIECVPYYLSRQDRPSAVAACVRCLGLATWCAAAIAR